MSAKSDDCGVGVSKAAWEDCSRYDHCDRRTKWVTPPRAYSAPSVPIARPPLAAPERAYLISESFEDVESPSTDKIAANDSLNVQCPHCGKLVTTTKTIDNCNRNHINSTESSLPLVQLTEACGRRVFFPLSQAVAEIGFSASWERVYVFRALHAVSSLTSAATALRIPRTVVRTVTATLVSTTLTTTF